MAATDDPRPGRIGLAALALLGVGAPALGSVLPEERADVLYHHYQGGGMDVSGPSVLVRENFQDAVSLSANYYVDSVSSASIDVMTTASPYTEQRTEGSLGVDYLHDKTTLGVDATDSDESDYHARTLSFSYAQDFFGDLSTLSLGWSHGHDEVRRNGDPSFGELATHDGFRFGFSQVLSKRALLGLVHEIQADQGYLHNPYRSVRFLDPTSARGFSYEPEVYPETRISGATALRVAYHLPRDGALTVEARLYDDTWGIRAGNAALGYVNQFDSHWRFEGRLRHYAQTRADFYSDLYPYRDAQNYLARDKELSSFASDSFGVGVAYELKAHEGARWKRMSLNLQVDAFRFRYDDFRDVRAHVAPGTEPEYAFDAVVTRLYGSLWY